MSWWDKDEKKDDWKDELQGKSPQQVAEELRTLRTQNAEASTKLTEFQTQLGAKDSEISTLRTEFDGLKNKLDEIDARNTPAPKTETNEPTSWFVDPDKANAERNAPLRAMAINAAAMTSKMAVRDTLSRTMNPIFNRPESSLFDKYEKEIQQVVATFPAESQATPQAWFSAFTMVKGMKANEIANAARGGNDFFSETPNGTPPSATPPEDKLTKEEEDVCRRMHWDPKGYLERRKELQHGDPRA